MLRDPVGLTPQGHPISMYSEVVNLGPHAHPHNPGALNNLDNSLFTRFDHLGELSDIEQAISLYSHATSTPIGTTSISILCLTELDIFIEQFLLHK
ncbi:hypothetical protein HD554DRAFT_2169762 [Boletus coccyginus]|nr:hypothetical protein HD554DRAFT_2169762 [Boletus coccyginus]